ncbi:hypothetical protein WN51_08758 [Melipona quadrifasciata]|uniref:Uncharacterized protein n=1 Tax=Melipona quadrifasciata TaxID=166423 RepID=A0A0N0BBK1_9HYME|nr:hypothetical protein WN51_08758 [Melipona quadrifasciata]
MFFTSNGELYKNLVLIVGNHIDNIGNVGCDNKNRGGYNWNFSPHEVRITIEMSSYYVRKRPPFSCSQTLHLPIAAHNVMLPSPICRRSKLNLFLLENYESYHIQNLAILLARYLWFDSILERCFVNFYLALQLLCYKYHTLVVDSSSVNIVETKYEGSGKEEGAKEEGAKEEGAKEEGAKEEGAKEEGAKEEGAQEEGAKEEEGAKAPPLQRYYSEKW